MQIYFAQGRTSWQRRTIFRTSSSIPTNLYREDVFTDRRAGSIRRLTPVTVDGADDPTRPVLFSGQTQLLTPAGVLPLGFEIEAKTLEEALQKFPDGVKVALEQAIDEAREMRREAASRIVVPDVGGGPGGAGPARRQDQVSLRVAPRPRRAAVAPRRPCYTHAMSHFQRLPAGAALVGALAALFFLGACSHTHRERSGPWRQTDAHGHRHGGGPAARAADLTYPLTLRGSAKDNYFGTEVADPYRWLEDLDSPAVKQWVAAQNALSRPQLQALPARAWLKTRLTQLWNYERYELPVQRGTHYFYLHNDGHQNQSALYVSELLAGPGRVLFDPNTARADATVALSDFTPSEHGETVAYAVSDGGTDWQIWRFRRARDGSDLPDTLRFTKFWGVSWAHDGSGVYYSRYPSLTDGRRGDDAGRPAIYFHRLGTRQDEDRLVYRSDRPPDPHTVGRVTEDGHYLVITLVEGYEKNGVMLLDLRTAGATPMPLFMAWDALYTFIGAHGEELFFATTQGAPLGRVIIVDARGARECARGRARGHDRDPGGDLRRRADRRQVRRGGARRGARLRARRARGRHRAAAGHGWHRRVSRRGHPDRDVLLLYRLPDAATHLPLRREDESGGGVARAQGGRVRCRPRHRAGLLSQQGRHPGADVHHPPA